MGLMFQVGTFPKNYRMQIRKKELSFLITPIMSRKGGGCSRFLTPKSHDQKYFFFICAILSPFNFSKKKLCIILVLLGLVRSFRGLLFGGLDLIFKAFLKNGWLAF